MGRGTRDQSLSEDQPGASRAGLFSAGVAALRAATSVGCSLVFLVMIALLPATTAAQSTPGPQRGPDAGAASDRPTTGLTSVAPAASAAVIPDATRPLGLPAHTQARPTPTKADAAGTTANVVRTATSLVAVVGLILAAAWVVRSLARRQGGIMAAVGPGGRAPSGVVEVLARYPVARSQTLILLRLPRRVVVLAQTRGVRGASSLTSLSEITDAEEIADLVHRTREADNQTLSRKFGSILSGEERGLAKVLGAVVGPPRVTRDPRPSPTPVQPSAPARRVTATAAGDRVELGSSKASSPVSDPAKRGYSGARAVPKQHAPSASSDADIQQRLAALRKLAIERNGRAS